MTTVRAEAEWEPVARALSIEGQARLVRLGMAAVWETSDGRIVRVDSSAHPGLISRLEAWISLAESGLPMLQPLLTPDGGRYLYVGHRVITVWPMATPVSQVDFDWAWLGSTLSSLHQVSVAGLDRRIPSDYVAMSLSELERTGAYSDAIEPLRRQLTTVAAAVDWDQHPKVPVHGDAHPGNVVSTDDGLRLIDFESLSIGNPLWDLMAVALLGRRYAVPATSVKQAFVSYGWDPTDDPMFEPMLRLRELLDAIAAARRAAASPTLGGEANKRLTDLMTGRSSVWVSVHPGNEAELERRDVGVLEAIRRGELGDAALQ